MPEWKIHQKEIENMLDEIKTKNAFIQTKKEEIEKKRLEMKELCNTIENIMMVDGDCRCDGGVNISNNIDEMAEWTESIEACVDDIYIGCGDFLGEMNNINL
jgi:hypothetical protein